MTEVWVLDEYGYDAGGFNARVFSTLERAKAAVPHVNDQAVQRVRCMTRVDVPRGDLAGCRRHRHPRTVDDAD